jgi:hypothetical protein
MPKLPRLANRKSVNIRNMDRLTIDQRLKIDELSYAHNIFARNITLPFGRTGSDGMSGG